MLKSFSWVVVGNLVRQLAFLAVNAVLYERLSRANFGALALAFGYMTVFAGLGDFGIRQIGWREVARHPGRLNELAGPFLQAKALVSLLVSLLYLGLMPLLWSADLPNSIYLLYGLGVLLNGGTFDFPLFGLNRLDLFAKFSAISYGVYLLACLLLVHRDDETWLVPLIFVGSMGLLFVLEIWWLGSRGASLQFRGGWKRFPGILRESWPLGLGETLNRLTLTYPLILIGLAIGGEGVGNYRIAEMGYSFVAQFGHMFASTVFSRLSSAFQHRPSDLFRIVYRFFGIAVFFAAFGGACFLALGPISFEIVFGEVSQGTESVLRVLGVALLFSAPARFLRTLLPSIDQQNSLLMVNGLSVIVGAGVGWFAMSGLDIVGMAVGVLTAEVVSVSLLSWIFWRRLK